jgi:4-hydroxy-3-methylbut-2-enyl diphosphate reductase
MMDLLLAKDMGFCFGVKRAIKLARDIRKKTEENVYTMGSLIHNPQVVEKLRGEGIVPVSDLSEADGGYVVIRSHGVSPEVRKDIKERGLKVIDATCPLVKRAQEKAMELVKDGYETFVVGEKDHPEVEGIVGYTGGRVQVINVDDEVEIKEDGKVGLIAQTTQSMQSLEDAIIKLLPKTKELKVFNTICEVTDRRQEEVRRLAGMVDAMVVIGGKKSANTSRLAVISRNEGCMTHHIETVDELKEDWFEGRDRVGVVAGASTPYWVIDEVICKLNEIA